MNTVSERGQTITFYSYKGGTGRSMALANLACLLARAEGKNKKVLAVDWDLEAPGLHRYFFNYRVKNSPNKKETDRILYEKPGLIDLFILLNELVNKNANEQMADEILEKANVGDFILETSIPNLSLITAGRFDNTYSNRVATLSWVKLYQRAPWLFSSLATHLTKQFGYVLIDSRTGLTDTGGICTALIPEKLVVVFTPNRQSILGIVDVVREATQYRRESDDWRPLLVFPLPSRIDVAKPQLFKLWRKGDNTQEWEGYQPLFERLFEDVYDLPKCDLEKYFDEVQVQHVSDYAYGEEIAALDEENDYRLSLTRSYEHFKTCLVLSSGPWEQGAFATRTAQIVRNVPYLRNPNFTGQENTLRAIRTELLTRKVLALTGLGGVGKTQLAIEYAYRYAANYRIEWWIRAELPTTLIADYAALAGELDLPEKDGTDQKKITDAVRRWLGQNAGWLLIFDNAGDRTDIRSYIPPTGTGHVLISSRNVNWKGLANTLHVSVLERDESVKFLLNRTAHTDEVAAGELAEALGNLPLALEQAGAYIDEKALSLADYLKLFRTRRRELLQRGESSTEYPTTVAKTWEMSFQQVKKDSPAAADLMNLCSFLAPDDIPLEVITKGGRFLPQPLAEAAADPLVFNEAIGAIRRYSLVDVHGNSLHIHRLIQTVVRDQLSEDDARVWVEAAVLLINDAFPEGGDVRAWPICERLLPHAMAVKDHVQELQLAYWEMAWLLNKIGVYLDVRAVYAEAKDVLDLARATAEATYCTSPRSFADIINNLGRVLSSLGQQENARKHFERALAIIEHKDNYGPNHPEVAKQLNILGFFLKGMRNEADLVSARNYFERALSINKAAYGPQHPEVATSLKNLGILLKDQGNLAEAHKYYEEALAVKEAAYGPDAPELADDINAFGFLLKDQGKLAEARAQFERALAIKETAYGAEHPEVVSDLESLGVVLKDQGDMQRARECFRQALEISEKLYGPKHPNVAKTLSTLGFLLKDEGDYEGALKYFKRSLAVNEAVYGPEHPNVASTLRDLAIVLREQGDLKGAREYFERALNIFLKSYKEDHVYVNTVRENLAGLGWTKGGNLEEPKESLDGGTGTTNLP